MDSKSSSTLGTENGLDLDFLCNIQGHPSFFSVLNFCLTILENHRQENPVKALYKIFEWNAIEMGNSQFVLAMMRGGQCDLFIFFFSMFFLNFGEIEKNTGRSQSCNLDNFSKMQQQILLPSPV